jgi:hypothetical protein
VLASTTMIIPLAQLMLKPNWSLWALGMLTVGVQGAVGIAAYVEPQPVVPGR